MRLALISDLHANLEALRAVIAAIDGLKPDRVVCLGDVVGYGPDPSACIALIREHGWPTLAGNWDLAVAARPGYDPGAFNPQAQASLWWTRGATSPEERAWLACLPEEIITDGMHLVHASPGPDHTRPYILDAAQTRAAFDQAQAPTVVIGHTHRAIAFVDGDPITAVTEGSIPIGRGKVLVNAGSVGQPRDNDPRACWCLADTAAGRIEWVRTPYDVAGTVAKLQASGLPPVFAERLPAGR